VEIGNLLEGVVKGLQKEVEAFLVIESSYGDQMSSLGGISFGAIEFGPADPFYIDGIRNHVDLPRPDCEGAFKIFFDVNGITYDAICAGVEGLIQEPIKPWMPGVP
jgi:hypothetical protein